MLTIRSPRRRLAVLIGVVALLLLLTSLAFSRYIVDRPILPIFQNPPTPRITWSESSVEVTLSPGQSFSKSLSLVSSEDLFGISVRTSPSVSGFLTSQPSYLRTLRANHSQPVQLNLSIPENSPGGAFIGSIFVESGSGQLESSLVVKVNVLRRVVTKDGMTIYVPPNLFFKTFPDRPRLYEFQSTLENLELGGGVLSNNEPVASEGFKVTVIAEDISGPFSINTWLDQKYPYSTVGAVTDMSVGGIRSYRITFAEEIGAGEPVVIVPTVNGIYSFSYASSYEPGSQQEQEALTIFNQMLQSVSFDR